MNLFELSISNAHRLLKEKKISAVELTRSVLDRIDAVDHKIGAYLTVDQEEAVRRAESADQMIAAGRMSFLTGIPIAVKDVLCTEDLTTTCASKILENFVPPYDATVIRKLKEQGAIIIGKTNMDEFAMGSTTENSRFQTTCNPWHTDYIPGGSSGGSAAAVAGHMCLGSLGSDTGGSIRQPASHCGVVGMKPTYGRVSRFGLIAFASSLDQAGPLTKDVTDCALMMNAVSGYDPCDSTSVPKDVPDFTTFLTKGLSGLTVGVFKRLNESGGLDPEVAAAVDDAIAVVKNLGATCVDISLPHTDYGVAAYYVIAPSEACSNLARYDGVKYGFRDSSQDTLSSMYANTRAEGFGTEVCRRILIGTYCLSAGYYDAYYKKASQIRTLIINDFKKAFEKCDVILSPAAPTAAFKIGEVTDDPLKMYLTDVFTLPANLTGIPGLSVPCGFTSSGLPIGLQFLGNHFNEGLLIKVGYNFEQATNFHHQKALL